MIKYYYTIASLLAVYAVFLKPQGEVTSDSEQDVSLATMQLQVSSNPDTLYEFEKNWIAKAQELNKPKQPPKEPEKPELEQPKGSLMIGAQHYTLLGVFTEPDAKFIVLKNQNKQIVRVKEGAAISPLATLVAVKTDNIEVKVGNEITIHKLFKRTQNEVNEKL
ncbi:hypothetical protein [Pseudoalteromonas aurantia]|uniref:Uncharacterized protein n=1 Tax=Pseudoalteromonas aurantia TaxID=43654 RepID=A0A5S3VCV4_9GAMM|nr:hypothetical protein [Pseudoalteromonas aurantia]TMO69991.1 hypothetical protein CWC19_03080 [Pseudoalteromonas aurantia]TMO75947.1 hypothetical protein CWC20_06740 [Pseudoalteromonas aurantia]